MPKKFRAVIRFDLDITLTGVDAESIARELHKGMVDILKSMGAEMDDTDPGLMTMQGSVNPAPEPAPPTKAAIIEFPN